MELPTLPELVARLASNAVDVHGCGTAPMRVGWKCFDFPVPEVRAEQRVVQEG
jgi:hypothetical protein